MVRAVTILGATGSIGRQALQVLSAHRERVRLRALTAHSRAADLLPAIAEFAPERVVVRDEEQAGLLLAEFPRLRVLCGEDALERVAAEADGLVLNALLGAVGIRPTLAALRAGCDVALANKETLVAAGDIVMAAARRAGARVIPVDSEHSALFQCLRGYSRAEVRRLILTASGGPFRGLSRERLAGVGRRDALAHPNWRMGEKITVDCATLMNKGLEVIEAHHLFDCAYDDIDVLVHPQSIVHSLVEYRDGALLAQLGAHDMRLPIQYALFADELRPAAAFSRLDLAAAGTLAFAAPDGENFPALPLAYACGRAGKTAPAVMNAANEVAVERFLAGELDFLGIVEVVRDVVAARPDSAGESLDEILAADAWARAAAAAAIDERRRRACR